MCFRSKKKTPAAPSKEKQTEDDTCQCPIESPPEHLLQVNYQKKIFTVQKCHPKVVSTYFQKSGDFLTVFCFGFSRKNLAWGQKCDIFVKGNVETSATLNDLIIFRGHMTLNQTLTSSSVEKTLKAKRWQIYLAKWHFQLLKYPVLKTLPDLGKTTYFDAHMHPQSL